MATWKKILNSGGVAGADLASSPATNTFLKTTEAGVLSWASATNVTNNNQLTNGAGYITGISFANVSSKPAFVTNSMLSSRSTTAIDTVGDSNGVTFNYLSSSTTNKPSGTDHALMTMSYSNAWQTQLAQDWRNKGRMYLRGQENGTWSSWIRVHSTDDFSTTDVANGVTAHGWGNHASAGYLTAHPSITEAADVNNSNGTVIQDLTFDDNGHVTATGSVDLDGRYYTETEIDNELDTLSASLRANTNITGGGTITVNSSGYIKNSARFIVIANGRGSHFATSGYFDINIPITGTVTGVGGSSNKTATSNGVPLDTWEALYYILPVGSGNASVAANFRVAKYTANVVIPETWILLAIRNGDSGQKVWVINKYGLELGHSVDTTVYDSRFSQYAATAGDADTLDGNHASAFSTASGVENNADVTDTANVVAALTAGTNVSISAGGTISSTDTNTTYSVGNGGLTEINFTSADNTKLDGIATGATNVTNNNQLTNGAGYQTASTTSLSNYMRLNAGADVTNYSHVHRFYSNTNMATASGSQSSLECYSSGSGSDAFMTFHVGGDYAIYLGLDGGTNKLSVGGWSMGANSYEIYHAGNKPSLATLGYTGATNANYITNNNQLTNGAGYVTTDTNTQLSNEQVQDIVGGMVDENIETNISVTYDDTKGKLDFVSTNTTYSTATSSALGLVKIGYTETGKNYPVKLSSGKMFVNVPWTDTITGNTNNYADSLAFSTGTGVLTLGRSGSLADLTVDLDGKYAESSHTHSYLPLSGGTLTGALTGTSATFSGNIVITSTTHPQINIDSSGHTILAIDSASGNYECSVNFKKAGTTKWQVGMDNYSAEQNDFIIKQYGNNNASGAFRIDTSNDAHFGTGASSGGGSSIYLNRPSWCYVRSTHSSSKLVLRASTNGLYLNAGATSWTVSSDERLKDIISPIDNAVSIVNGMRAVVGKYKTDEVGTQRSFLIAQDAQEVFPIAVTESVDDLTGINTLGLNYTDFIPVLIKAVQEQDVIIKDLQNQIQALT